jgi:hypothetical protein
MNGRGSLWRAAIASLLIGLTGCYSYVPLSGATPERGTQVRARLNQPASFTLADVTVNNVVLIDAEVVRSGEDSLVVSALWLRSQAGMDFPAAGETLAIEAGSVGAIETRRMSLLRSSALIVAAGAAASLLFASLGTLDSGGGGGKPSPRPD